MSAHRPAFSGTVVALSARPMAPVKMTAFATRQAIARKLTRAVGCGISYIGLWVTIAAIPCAVAQGGRADGSQGAVTRPLTEKREGLTRE
jgi:hypothetical protein